MRSSEPIENTGHNGPAGLLGVSILYGMMRLEMDESVVAREMSMGYACNGL